MADVMSAGYDPASDVVTIRLDRDRAEALADIAMEAQIVESENPTAGLHSVIDYAIEDAKDRTRSQ